MAEAALMNSERVGGLEPDSESALFHRRIEFHAARKPFNGFGNSSSNGFKLVTLNPNTEHHKAAASAKKSEKSELVETRLDPELSFEITFRRIGAGLRNLGNTCFLNSVLQCLTYTEPLAAYLQSGKHQSSCRNAGFCALCAIQKHVSRALQATGRILEPKDLVSNLRCISRSFRNARQEDAHEYMVNLLESMHKCCLPSGVPSESPGAYDRSLVHKIFGGRLRSQVKCMQCSFCSNKFDPFLDLSLEIVKADSLLKALAHFTAKEQLDGGAKQYQCQQCKQKVKALKQLTIHKAPHVLSVHLKRFGSHVPGQKIDRKVSFGPTLDLKPFVTGPYDGDLKYTLYGVLVHAGWSTHSGHYYCFVRTSSGMWYNLDDNQVVQVSERKVLEQKAYMLFYVRDRRNSFTKKPVDLKRENMVMNAIGNGTYSKLNLELKEKSQNGLIEKKSDGSLSGRDAIVATEMKEAPSTKLLSQNVKASIGVDNMGLEKDFCSTVKNNSVGHKGEPCLTVEVKNSFNVSANSNLPQDSLPKKESSDSVTISEKSDSKIMSVEPIAEALNKVNLLKSSQQNSIGEGQVGGPSVKTGEETHENGSSVATEQLSLVVTKNKKPKLKVRRKLFKYQVATMSLSSNIIFSVGLCLQKKKHKLRKHHSEKKKAKCGTDGKNKTLNTQNSVIPSDVIKNEFINRVSLNGTARSSAEKQQVMQSAGNSEDCQRESRQTDVMSILTRGLEETTVARWDEIDDSFSVQSETRTAGTAPIGYIGDEWDEEYDRGKRKKIRDNKISFGGPNLFQEIATRNLKRKKAKLDKSSFRNQPFRI